MQPSQRFLIRCLAALACLAIVSTSATAVAAEIINVVATFSVLGDMTSRIGGPRVQVHALVGPDADAHVYQPTPADAKTIAQARLVIINGFGFEGWIARLIKSSGYRGEVLIASKGVRTLARQTGDREPDPHAWQDLANALRYVDNIAQALGDVDPAGQAEYRSNAEKYKAKIRSLDADIRQQFGCAACGAAQGRHRA
jgi:zinc/manganese transport system substrate-binding protein